MNTSTYTVAGMTCGHCVNAVTTEISGLPAVTDVRVDLDTGRVMVTSLGPLSEGEVTAAVERAGYGVVAGAQVPAVSEVEGL